MAIGLKLNFDNLYEIETISEDKRSASFNSILKDGSSVPLYIEISNEVHTLLPNVYNLAFGPLNRQGNIDDKAELTHGDYSKVFSTILFHGLHYLTGFPGRYLGIDGSDNRRAYYYWRTLQHNYEFLNQFFELFGIKYYVRISRFGKQQFENPFDFEDILPYPDRIHKTIEWPKTMYNYFIFKLKDTH